MWGTCFKETFLEFCIARDRDALVADQMLSYNGEVHWDLNFIRLFPFILTQSLSLFNEHHQRSYFFSLVSLKRSVLVSSRGTFPLEPVFNLWVAIGFVIIERRFAVEAKSFSFLAFPGKTEMRLEERRKGFIGSFFLSLQCSDWLADTVEAASLSLGEEDFAKSFREKGKVLMVHKGWNKSNRFLVAVVFAEGGRRGGIWFPKGREGWGWRCIVGELRKCLGFLAVEERPLIFSVNAGGGSIRSFAAVTSGSMS